MSACKTLVRTSLSSITSTLRTNRPTVSLLHSPSLRFSPLPPNQGLLLTMFVRGRTLQFHPKQPLQFCDFKLIQLPVSVTNIKFSDILAPDEEFRNSTKKKGISDEALALSDLHCSIPMKGMVDSFNVSVAAGLLMHHAVCDRTSRLGSHGDLTSEESQILLS